MLVCRAGCAADMTSHQMRQLQICFPDELDYVEPDGQVRPVCLPAARPLLPR